MRARPVAIFLIFAVFLSFATGFAQTASAPIKQFAELIASDGQSEDVFGIAVAINGTTVVVGAQHHNLDQGTAYVYETGGNKAGVHQVAELTASDALPYDYFGGSVAVSDNTIVVGSWGGNNGTQPGSTYVFVKPPSGWTNMTQTAKLTASDGTNNNSFGASVSISGNTIVVGADSALDGAGAAYVFVEPPGGWVNMTQTAELTASDGKTGDGLGAAVSIGGNTIVVGAPNASIQYRFQGAGYVFVQPGDGWVDTTETGKLVASDPQEEALLGELYT